jgi:hypothetical protein
MVFVLCTIKIIIFYPIEAGSGQATPWNNKPLGLDLDWFLPQDSYSMAFAPLGASWLLRSNPME